MATIDERLEALARSLELLELLVNEGLGALKGSTENLLKVAQIHEQRIQRLEDKL